MDAVFRALSDPARRRLLDRLNERNGLTLGELCAGMGMTRQSVSQHLDVLEDAQVVATSRRGREKLHHLHAAPINDIADRWIHHYDRPMDHSDDTTFVYTTYINATPERVWQGPTDPAFTERSWRHPRSGGVAYRTDGKRAPPMTWPTTGSGSWCATPSR